MADVFDQAKRSDIMKRVRPSGNKSTELKLIEIFKSLNITGWRRNYPVIGHPDFVFLERKVAIFVDGCFWHGHDCRNTMPADNAEYWAKKRMRNIEHDKAITELFEHRGWTVVRIWECELKKKNLPDTLARIQEALAESANKRSKIHLTQDRKEG